MPLFFMFVLIVLLTVLVVLYRRQLVLRRESYIRSFELPYGLFERLRKARPELSLKECQLVAHGLRQFFLAHLKSGRRFVSMPSQVVDDLWHEFILYTKNYDDFCRRAFGRFLHHTPAVVLGSQTQSNVGLRRCWWYSCVEENINPAKPSRLPLLFALDKKLKIAGGFAYVTDCGVIKRRQAGSESSAIVYCGGDFSSSGIDGSTAGFGDSGNDAGGGSEGGGDSGGGSDSSGCGGGGCGGGGGGD